MFAFATRLYHILVVYLSFRYNLIKIAMLMN